MVWCLEARCLRHCRSCETASSQACACCSSASIPVSARLSPATTSRASRTGSGSCSTNRGWYRNRSRTQTTDGCRNGATASPTSCRGRRRASTRSNLTSTSTGRVRLRRKIMRYRPRLVALVGVTVFRAMFSEHKGPVPLGLRQERIGDSGVFVLPNPSGRNANYSYADMLRAFRALRRANAIPGVPVRRPTSLAR